MANLSKIKRDNMMAFLEELKKTHSDDASIRALNEIENHLRDKKYGLVWEEHTEEVDERLLTDIPVLIADPERRLCKDSALPWNFIIEGDNLQALYLLEKTHRGKVDCIYIDPPYNTGAKDWKYNNDYVAKDDEYRHSKWLSMMKSRLLIAKKLLNPDDSVLIVTIDEKEYLHLGCLLEEMFPTARMQMISSIIKPEGTNRRNEFSRTNEFIFIVMLGEVEIAPSTSNMFEIDDNDDVEVVQREIEWRDLRRRGAAAKRSARPNQFYPIFINNETGHIHSIGNALKPYESREEILSPEGCYAFFPISPKGVETMWSKHYATAQQMLTEGYIKAENGTNPKKVKIRYLPEGIVDDIKNGKIILTGKGIQGEVEGYYQSNEKLKMPKTLWYAPSHNAQTCGSLINKKIFTDNRFDFPKSLYAVRDTIRFFVANKPNALIVDFFAGSGTTQHAVNLLNAEDGGKRRCIMVTNNEISAEEEKRLKKNGYKKGDDEWETLGIAKYVTWPRTVGSINGTDVNGAPLKGDYLAKKPDGTTIPMAEGFSCNVKYFKCDWTPRKPEDYLLSNALCLHIREMIELQNAIEIDNVKNVLILNKSDFKNIIMNPNIYAQIENVWVNQNIILNAEELKLLETKGFKYIPREFFGQELKEVAE